MKPIINICKNVKVDIKFKLFFLDLNNIIK